MKTMKKQTLIIIILAVLMAAVIALSVLGIVGPQGSLAGYRDLSDVPQISPPVTTQVPSQIREHSYPTVP